MKGEGSLIRGGDKRYDVAKPFSLRFSFDGIEQSFAISLVSATVFYVNRWSAVFFLQALLGLKTSR